MENRKEYMQQYYQEHKSNLDERHENFYHNHRELVLAYLKRYRDTHKEQRNVYQRRYRQMRKGRNKVQKYIMEEQVERRVSKGVQIIEIEKEIAAIDALLLSNPCHDGLEMLISRRNALSIRICAFKQEIDMSKYQPAIVIMR
jgi:hypothetical protein